MPPYERTVPYNTLQALPPPAECYKDEELITLLTSASRKLAELEAIGILAKSKIGKEYVWFNTELMDILSSEC